MQQKIGDIIDIDGIKWEVVYVDDIRATSVNENGQIMHSIRTDANTIHHLITKGDKK